MSNPCHSSKIKNDKMLRWHLQLSEYLYDIKYRPGSDMFLVILPHVCPVAARADSAFLEEVHVSLRHSGVTRLYHFLKVKNLAFSLEDEASLLSVQYLLRI